MLARRADQKLYRDNSSKHHLFVPGQPVTIRDFQAPPRQVPGIIQEKLGPITFSVQGEGGSMFKHHLDHLAESHLMHLQHMFLELL